MAEIVPSRIEVICSPVNEEGNQMAVQEGDYAEEGPVEEYLSKHPLMREIAQTVGEVVKSGGFLFIHYPFICGSAVPYLVVLCLSICNEIFSTSHLSFIPGVESAVFRGFMKIFSQIRSIFISSIFIIVGGYKLVEVIYYKAITEKLSNIPYYGTISIFSLIIYFISILSKISPNKEKVSLKYVLFSLVSFISLGVLSYLLFPTLGEKALERPFTDNVLSSIPLAVLSSFLVTSKESRKSKPGTDEKFKNTLIRAYTLLIIYSLFLAYGIYASRIHHSLERTIPEIDVFSELTTVLIRLYSKTAQTRNSPILRSILTIYDALFMYFVSSLAIYHLKSSYLKSTSTLKYFLGSFNREESNTYKIIFQVVSKITTIAITGAILRYFLRNIPSGDTQRTIAIIGGAFGISSSIYRILFYRRPNLSTRIEACSTFLLAICIISAIITANDLSRNIYREVLNQE